MILEEALERVPDCLAAAWIDSRTGAILEHRRAAGQGAAGDQALELLGLEAVAEIVCTPERPRRMVLMSSRRVYVAQRPVSESPLVLVVVCARPSNLGLSVALVAACLQGAGS